MNQMMRFGQFPPQQMMQQNQPKKSFLQNVKAELSTEKFGLSRYQGRWAEYFASSKYVHESANGSARKNYLKVRCARFGADVTL